MFFGQRHHGRLDLVQRFAQVIKRHINHLWLRYVDSDGRSNLFHRCFFACDFDVRTRESIGKLCEGIELFVRPFGWRRRNQLTNDILANGSIRQIDQYFPFKSSQKCCIDFPATPKMKYKLVIHPAYRVTGHIYQGKLELANRSTFPFSMPQSRSSICMRNSFLNRLDASCSPGESRFVAKHSNSSMKTTDGAYTLAIRNKTCLIWVGNRQSTYWLRWATADD